MPSPLCSRLLGAAIAAAVSFTVSAQPAQGPAAVKVVDCSKSPNPERCEARKAARAACQDKAGAERRKCVDGRMPPPDCGKSPNPARCEANLAARDACRDKMGPAHRQCMRDKMKDAGPGTGRGPGRMAPQ